MGYESIDHEAEGRMVYWLRAHEGERNNCFSKIQLVGQKNIKNRGEEEVWVQMNVVPRSTGNTNSGTRELTLKCKLKCYFKPMNNPLGVSPSKEKQRTTRGKEKIFCPRWESNPRPTD